MLGHSSFSGIEGRLVLRIGLENRQDPANDCFSFPIGCTQNEWNQDVIICDTGHNMVCSFSLLFITSNCNFLLLSAASQPILSFLVFGSNVGRLGQWGFGGGG